MALADLVLPLLLLTSASRWTAAEVPSSLEAFLGTWKGTSTCVDLKAAPACKDEVVVYEVTKGPKAGSALMKADKIVDGKREPMGELTFTYSEPEGAWVSEFRNTRVHLLWRFVINGRRIEGEALLLPARTRVREVRVTGD